MTDDTFLYPNGPPDDPPTLDTPATPNASETPNAADDSDTTNAFDRRRFLAGTATASVAGLAGCAGVTGGGASDAPTVVVFNTGDGTVTLIDPTSDEAVGTRAVGLASSFPSNQFTPRLADDPDQPLWLDVGRGVRALAAGSLDQTASVETGSGANWQERTPNGDHLIVSAREPAHRQFRIDADPASDEYGTITGEIDRRPEGGRGDNDGPGPCDVTVHPDGEFAYVPDLFGDTLTVLRIDPFEIATQVPVERIGDGPANPWMATVSPDGETLTVEHNEGRPGEGRGTESVWDLSDPARPTQRARLTGADDLGSRPLTSEIGPDSETAYVFTPGSNDVTVVDLTAGSVTDRLALGGSAFVGTWNPAHTRLYVPVRSNDEVAVIDHASREITARIDVGPSPYGATSARVRPGGGSPLPLGVALARLGVREYETTYCIGECACGHEL